MKLQLDPNSSKPLHQQAEDLLRRMIQQEEYRKGKLLPNEVELSKDCLLYTSPSPRDA